MRGLIIGKLNEEDQEIIDNRLESMQQDLKAFQLEVDLTGVGSRVTKLSLNDLNRFPKQMPQARLVVLKIRNDDLFRRLFLVVFVWRNFCPPRTC